MAAFNFPDPLVQQTVTNTITGSTYQWKEPPGKWVVISRSQTSTDIIYEGDTPPIPRGEYKLWYSTDTLELYFWYEDTNGTSAWIPTSKPITGLEAVIAEVDAAGVDIAQAKREILENYDDIQRLQTSVLDAADIYHGDTAPTDDKYDLWYHTDDLELLVKIEEQWFPCTPNSRVDNVPTLQQVLEAGPPVALKDIYLTNAQDDIIDLSVTEGRVVIGTIGEDLAPKLELRHKEGSNDAVAIFELDEGGTRLDIEADGRIDNIHFRFDNDHKFILNKTGDAEFIGRVKSAPAISDDELVTYAQLKNYLEPEFLRYMWDPTITNFNDYTNGQTNQDNATGQLCSMTGATEDAVWHFISDRDLDGNLLRAPLVNSVHSPFDLEIYVEGEGDYLKPPYVNVYMDGKEYKKRFTVNQCQRSKAVVPPPTLSVFYPWFEINSSAVNWINEFWNQKREIFIKVK